MYHDVRSVGGAFPPLGQGAVGDDGARLRNWAPTWAWPFGMIHTAAQEDTVTFLCFLCLLNA